MMQEQYKVIKKKNREKKEREQVADFPISSVENFQQFQRHRQWEMCVFGFACMCFYCPWCISQPFYNMCLCLCLCVCQLCMVC